MLISDFTVRRNKPRTPRPLTAFDRELLRERLRLALASLALAHDPHVPAAAQQIAAALRQVEGA